MEPRWTHPWEKATAGAALVQAASTSPLTGATLFSFGYDSAGRLASITDGDGNMTTIERNSNGNGDHRNSEIPAKHAKKREQGRMAFLRARGTGEQSRSLPGRRNPIPRLIQLLAGLPPSGQFAGLL